MPGGSVSAEVRYVICRFRNRRCHLHRGSYRVLDDVSVGVRLSVSDAADASAWDILSVKLFCTPVACCGVECTQKKVRRGSYTAPGLCFETSALLVHPGDKRLPCNDHVIAKIYFGLYSTSPRNRNRHFRGKQGSSYFCPWQRRQASDWQNPSK